MALALSSCKAAPSCGIAVRGKAGRAEVLPRAAEVAADVALLAASAFLKPACKPQVVLCSCIGPEDIWQLKLICFT